MVGFSCGETDFSGREKSLVASQDAARAPDVIDESPGRSLTGIAIVPRDANLIVGSTTPYLAYAQYDDGSQREVTLESQWRVEDQQVIKVGREEDEIRVYAEKLGQTIIAARFEDREGSTTVTVVEGISDPISIESIEVLPGDAVIDAGQVLEYQAVAHLSDGTTLDITQLAEWFSSDTALAAFDEAVASKIVGKSVGSIEVSAVFEGVTGTAVLKIDPAKLVSLVVLPNDVRLFDGEIQTYTALGTYGDATVKDISAVVAWTSANPAIGNFLKTAGSLNKFLAASAGITDVVATLGSISGSAKVTVKVIPGVPVERFGINYEDLDSIINKNVVGGLGDPLVDYNDFAICFDGKARIDGQSITSLEDQKITFYAGHDSACSHNAYVRIYEDLPGGGTKTLSEYSFATPTEPKYENVSFPKFAKIYSRISITAQFDCPNSLWEINNTLQVEVLKNICRFKTPPPVK
jgi:hypothetical protein